MADELWRKSAHELAAMISSKQVSSREVVTSHLERIEAVNPRVNAVTVTLAESALAAADKADASQATGPFHGVPFTIKENIDCTGSATTMGLPVFAESLPVADAPERFVSEAPAALVRRLLGAWPLHRQRRYFEEVLDLVVDDIDGVCNRRGADDDTHQSRVT